MSARKQRTRILDVQRHAQRRRPEATIADQTGDEMAPVGRKFGSPDFERLTGEDFRLGRGVFDPALCRAS